MSTHYFSSCGENCGKVQCRNLTTRFLVVRTGVFLCGLVVEHCVVAQKVVGSIPREHMYT